MIDLFQTDNADSKAFVKVVQSYKRTAKIAFKIYPKPKQRWLREKLEYRQAKSKIMFTVLWNIKDVNKPTKPT